VNSLVFVKKDVVFTDSLVIAKEFEKTHRDVLRDIRNQIEYLIAASENEEVTQEERKDLRKFAQINFKESTYIDNGRTYPKFDLTEDAFALVVMSYSTHKAMRMKVRFIQEFKRMRSILLERKSSEWMETRIKGKLVRRAETDAIADLIAYAKSQGSKNAEKLYMTYTKLVNKTIGIESGQRDKASFKVLQVISMMEDMILHTIMEDMAKGVYYKEIYKHCKERAQQMVELMYLPEQKLIAS